MLFSKSSLVLAKFVVATMAPSGRERFFSAEDCCVSGMLPQATSTEPWTEQAQALHAAC